MRQAAAGEERRSGRAGVAEEPLTLSCGGGADGHHGNTPGPLKGSKGEAEGGRRGTKGDRGRGTKRRKGITERETRRRRGEKDWRGTEGGGQERKGKRTAGERTRGEEDCRRRPGEDWARGEKD